VGGSAGKEIAAAPAPSQGVKNELYFAKKLLINS
jgi:hypothetical protein